MTFQLWELVEGQGLWQDLKNNQTGEHSIKSHTPRTVMQGCTDHYFVEEGQSRHVVCSKCGVGKRYVLGKQKLVNGKLV